MGPAPPGARPVLALGIHRGARVRRPRRDRAAGAGPPRPGVGGPEAAGPGDPRAVVDGPRPTPRPAPLLPGRARGDRAAARAGLDIEGTTREARSRGRGGMVARPRCVPRPPPRLVV